ncbi:HAD family hydrolase [Caballeronia sp. KNU42]
MKELPFDAVMFDCDGTLVDSEPITTGVLADMLRQSGWQITQKEMDEFFVGRSVRDQLPLIETRTGAPVTSNWLKAYRARRDAELTERVTATSGVASAIAQLADMTGARLAVVSASDRSKVRLQLTKVGIIHRFGNNIFSGHDAERNKPHPDVYLEAAAAMDVPISRCAVVEDTVSGVTAGASAGATVFAYLPMDRDQGNREVLLQAGAVHVFSDMHSLPMLLASVEIAE